MSKNAPENDLDFSFPENAKNASGKDSLDFPFPENAKNASGKDSLNFSFGPGPRALGPWALGPGPMGPCAHAPKGPGPKIWKIENHKIDFRLRKKSTELPEHADRSVSSSRYDSTDFRPWENSLLTQK